MYQDLVKMKAKIDEQLSKISCSLKGMEVIKNIYNTIQMIYLYSYVGSLELVLGIFSYTQSVTHPRTQIVSIYIVDANCSVNC